MKSDAALCREINGGWSDIMSTPYSVSEDTMRSTIDGLARKYAQEITRSEEAADIADEATFRCMLKWRAGLLPESAPLLRRFVRRMVYHQTIRWLRECQRKADRDEQRRRDSRGSRRV